MAKENGEKKKTRGMGGIYKRGEVYWVYYNRHGKQYRESTKSTREDDAVRLLKKRQGEIGDGKLPGIHFEKVTYDELRDDLARQYRLDGKKEPPRTWHLDRFFSGYRAVSITTPAVQDYIEKRLSGEYPFIRYHKTGKDKGKPRKDKQGSTLADPGSNATINRELAALKRMLNLGAKHTPPKVNRVPYIPKLKEENVRSFFFTPEEYIALQETAKKDYPYLASPIRFAYYVGWRKEEIFQLTWDRVNLDEGTVWLLPGQTKNKEARWIHLPKSIIKMLKIQRMRTHKDCQWVFHRDGEQIKDFRFAWGKITEAAGLKGRTFHDLRRCGVRNLVRAGVSEDIAMTITGHKTRSVFSRYNITDDKDLKEAARKLEKYHSVINGESE